jgi:hypothetical protein
LAGRCGLRSCNSRFDPVGLVSRQTLISGISPPDRASRERALSAEVEACPLAKSPFQAVAGLEECFALNVSIENVLKPR